MNKIHTFKDFSRLNESIDPAKNIIIGDSCTPFIAQNTKDAIILSKTGSEQSLWKSGKGIKWLKDAVDKYPVNNTIRNVIINIGTNDGFNVAMDVSGLFTSLKKVFPDANFLAVQGSWGWGNNKNITASQVAQFYQKFAKEGAIIVNPPIGSVSDPHSNLPVYAQIGKAIDAILDGSTEVANKDNNQENGVYTTSSTDPYHYKVINGVWYTKGKTISDWKSLLNNKKANDILDNQFPNARTKEQKEENNKLY
jgi:hypothetical protein